MPTAMSGFKVPRASSALMLLSMKTVHHSPKLTGLFASSAIAP
jgi:hypothetical protein